MSDNVPIEEGRITVRELADAYGFDHVLRGLIDLANRDIESSRWVDADFGSFWESQLPSLATTAENILNAYKAFLAVKGYSTK